MLPGVCSLYHPPSCYLRSTNYEKADDVKRRSSMRHRSDPRVLTVRQSPLPFPKGVLIDPELSSSCYGICCDVIPGIIGMRKNTEYYQLSS